MSESPSKRRRRRDTVRDMLRPQAVADMIMEPTQKVFKAMNPVNIAGALNPHAQSIIRLFKPIVRPQQSVNWIRKQLTWKNLQAPLSAVAALVLGGLAALLSQSSRVKLSPASVISITTIVMEFGSTERFYVRSALRVVGTILGACVGFGLGALGILIGDEEAGVNVIGLQAYRLSMVALFGLITFMGMRIYSDNGHGFMMFGVTLFGVLFTVTWTSALTAMLSALAGVIVSILTIFVFQFPKTDRLLAQTHRDAAENLFTLARMSVESDPRTIEDFEECAVHVRKALTSTSASFEVYAQWRRWTQRKVAHNFDTLSTATRPLFYVTYSMYWNLVQSPTASPSGGVFFFCNSPTQYDKYFRTPRMMVEGSLMSIQASLTRILVRDPKDPCGPQQHMEMIVQRHLWHGCMRNIHILKESYISHREECFETFGQHWSVCDYLHQLISLTMAIAAYVHAIAEIFMPETAEYVYPVLEDICENLANMRHEGSFRTEHFTNHVNVTTGPDREYTGSQSFARESPATDLNGFTMISRQARMPRGLDMEELDMQSFHLPSNDEASSSSPSRRRALSP